MNRDEVRHIIAVAVDSGILKKGIMRNIQKTSYYWFDEEIKMKESEKNESD